MKPTTKELCQAAFASLPVGYGLFVLACLSHSDGETESTRYFAVKCGRLNLLRVQEDDFENRAVWEADAMVEYSGMVDASRPAHHDFCDSNSVYGFGFPLETQELIDGAWQPCDVAEYYY